MIKDGRLPVVEYNGALLVGDALEKRTTGEVWQRASAGTGVYLMAANPAAAWISRNGYEWRRDSFALPHRITGSVNGTVLQSLSF